MPNTQIIKAKYHDVYPFISPTEGLKDAAQGKNVLITGAGTGVGKAMTEYFAQASAKIIVLVGRRLEVLDKLKAELQPKFKSCTLITERADVSDEESVDSLFERVKSHGIEIDVLINNAGINGDYNPIKDSTVKGWWLNWEIMLKGPYIMTRAFLRARKTTNRHASIVMTSSVGANAIMPGMSSYQAVKAALNRLTEFVARETRDDNIHCVCFHPGGVAGTDITSKSPEWMHQFYTDTAELGAGTALYLSTERAAWLSGRYVDGRWDMEELEKLKTEIEEDELLKLVVLGDTKLQV